MEVSGAMGSFVLAQRASREQCGAPGAKSSFVVILSLHVFAAAAVAVIGLTVLVLAGVEAAEAIVASESGI